MSSQLQNKMYGYEVKPPPGMWDKIATALNDQETANNLSSKLYDFEVAPPELTWQQIKNSLEQDTEKPLSKPKMISYIYRYAAAVVITALMVFGGIRLIQNNSGKKEIAANKNAMQSKDSVAPSSKESAIAAPLNNSTEAEEKRDDAALEESKRTVAKNDFPAATKLRLARESYLTAPAHYIENLPDAMSRYPNLHYSDMIQPL